MIIHQSYAIHIQILFNLFEFGQQLSHLPHTQFKTYPFLFFTPTRSLNQEYS